MIEEIAFHEHRDTIAQLRREVYTSGLLHDIDEFDEAAHHFALFNAAREITGVIRVLRSDEVPKLELQSESDAQDLVFPQDGLIIEVSRGCARKSLTGMPMMKLAMAMQQYAKRQEAAHVVTKSGKRLLPLYQAMGFRVFGRPFYSDWFDDRNTGLMSIPIIYDFVKAPRAVMAAAQPEEEVLCW
ncbi:MAG: GNAT family N-acetyltransferase [Prosthecobacter sp.]|uniref:GNAT family N-acyltransferase n=1 Tax=Prosthecobacter sp. TaxID=1965333 RepID=UPI002616C4A8|nr:GNAT family N-acyltransferase [Prosthecobacter sp.]MCF7789021.1 GNAT family N-acetyltransferase [Prosthecobacter sp.]